MKEVAKNKLIKHFNKYFKKYSTLDSIGFFITSYDEDFYIATEDGYLNKISWQDFSDFSPVHKLDDAINRLNEIENDAIKLIIKKLQIIKNKLQKEIYNHNLLNIIYDDIFSEINFKKLSNKIKLNLQKDYNWKYIDYIFITINKNGHIEVQETFSRG